MSDHTPPDPASILPPDIEAVRQEMLAALGRMAAVSKEAVDAGLERPLSQEAYDYLVALATCRAYCLLAWTALEFPADQAEP